MCAGRVQDDLFAIPAGPDRYYLYAPLRRAVALVNGRVVAAVAACSEDSTQPASESDATILADLRAQGVLGDPAPMPPTFPENYEFCPHDVTLFLTSRCNLRCRYCYADAGKKAIDMPWEVARAAIDFVATNAGVLGSRKFAIGFHGGGEPTVAWDLLVRCVEHARQKGEQLGLDAEIYAATNGLLSPEQRHFVASNFKSLTVSLDGPEDIQDHNRPKVNGQGSYKEVRETLRYFNEVGFFYSIRSTVTASTVHQMADTVSRLHEEFQINDLHMEPAWCCGRCLTTDEAPPSDAEFIARFSEAVDVGRRLGVHVHYSGARLDMLTSKFCAAPGDGFSVLPEGVATSCYEITELADPRAEIFHYGRYDAENQTFVFDRGRIAALRRLSVENLPFCRDCFCRWHCAGDCLAKVFTSSGSTQHEGSLRCDLNRALTLAQLDAVVKGTFGSEATLREHGVSTEVEHGTT